MRLLSGTFLQGAARFTVKLLIVATATVGGGALVSSSVFAALSATATGTTSVTTGTLKLVQLAAGSGGGFVSGGFATAITGMAPSDTVNKFVTLTNSGTLDAGSTTLTVVGTGSTALTTSAANGLQVWIQKCSIAYTAVGSTGAGTCSGTASDVLGTSGTPVSANTLATPQVLNNLVVTAGAISFLKIAISLPAGTEVTADGVLPGGTIQGLTTTLSWTFTEQQRAATSTNT